jgi:hypothetical protein
MNLWYYGNSGTPAIDRWVQAHQLLVPWNEMEATRDVRLSGVNWTSQYGAINGTDANSQYESTAFFDDTEPALPKPWAGQGPATCGRAGI